MVVGCCCCAALRTKHIVFIGPRGSGVTTLVQHVVLGRPVTVVPSLRTEQWELDGTADDELGAHFTLWDIAARDAEAAWRGAGIGSSPQRDVAKSAGAGVAAGAVERLCKLLRKAFGVVFVADCAAPADRDADERGLFSWIVATVRPGAPIFVVANKQDVEGATTPAQLAAKLGLQGATATDEHQPSSWTCQPCVATSAALRPRRIATFFLTGDAPSMFATHVSPAVAAASADFISVTPGGPSNGTAAGSHAAPMSSSSSPLAARGAIVEDAQPMLSTRQPNFLHRVGQLPKGSGTQTHSYVPLDSE